MGVMAQMIQSVQAIHNLPTQELPITLIISQPQARRYFDVKELEKLKLSIQEVGILQPLLVLPESGTLNYRLIAGERRYRAAQMAGLKTVPVIILNPNEWTGSKLKAATLLENLQRQDLNKFEETHAIIELLALEFNIPTADVPTWLMRLDNQQKSPASQDDIEKVQTFFTRLGLMNWKSFVKNRIPILYLPENIQNSLSQGKISYTVALTLKKIKDEEKQNYWLQEAERGVSLSKIKNANRLELPTNWQQVRSRLQHTNWAALSPETRNALELKLEELLQLLPDSE